MLIVGSPVYVQRLEDLGVNAHTEDETVGPAKAFP